MPKETLKEMIDEDKDLLDEIVETPIEVVDDIADLQLGTAVRRTIAAPIRIAKNIFDIFDF